jgi:hypothetical protein
MVSVLKKSPFSLKALISFSVLVVLCLMSLLSSAIAAPISAPAQQVVDELEQKGYDVTFVYFGSDRELTFGAEDCAVVAMFTHEHIKNSQYPPSHEQQFSEGNKSLAKAYPNAEAFLVALIEDLNGNGVPDSVDNGGHVQGYYQLSGGVYGGRVATAFSDEYWVNYSDYVSGNIPSPSPSPTPTPTEQPQPKNGSILEVSCQSTASYMNFKVDITGRLLAGSGGIADAQVLLSYSVNAGESWLDLTTAITGSDGAFSEVWTPQVSGYYMLKADYRGNTEFSEANRTVNFVVLPFEEKNVFSVTSNSTVTALSFDSTKQTLSFSVNGTSNTTGYVSLYLPQSLVSDASTLKVYLDNEPLSYTATPENDVLLVTFTYHHSSHDVTIQINQQNSANDMYLWIAVFVVILLVSVVSVVAAIKRRKKATYDKPL